MQMKKKTGDETIPTGKLMKKTLNILAERSKDSLEIAKKELLQIKIDSKNGRQALEYYVQNLKNITHPGILSVACEAVGGKPDDATPMQVVTLLLAAAMDIHDDVIDQTKTKNGKPTILGKFGKNTTLLIGNAILMKGYNMLYKYGKRLPEKTMDQIHDTIQTTLFEVGNAHLLEADLRRKMDIDPDEYLRIIEKKAANIEAVTTIGAIIGHGSEKEIEALAKYGRTLGTLITLREEFVDIFEPEELQNRKENKCLPIPILYAFQDPKTKKNIVRNISQKRISSDATDEIVDTVYKSAHVKRLKETMKKLYSDATTILQENPKMSACSELKLLIRSTLEDL